MCGATDIGELRVLFEEELEALLVRCREEQDKLNEAEPTSLTGQFHTLFGQISEELRQVKQQVKRDGSATRATVTRDGPLRPRAADRSEDRTGSISNIYSNLLRGHPTNQYLELLPQARAKTIFVMPYP